MKRLPSTGAILAFSALLAAAPAQAQELFPDAPIGPADLAQTEKLWSSAFQFLKISPTARVSGMGDAYTAVAEGMDAAFWNPAGLTTIETVGYSFSYADWLLGTELYSGAIAFNIGWGSVVGISVVSLQFPDVEQTTPLNPLGTGEMLDLGDTAVGLVYARQLTDKLSVGGVVRFVESKLHNRNMSGTLFSVGTILHTGFRSLRIGMGMKNLGDDVIILSDASRMPIVFHVGTSLEVIGELGDPMSLTGSFEGTYFTDRFQRWSLGGELWLRDLLAVRAGRKWRYDAETWSVGAGLKAKLLGNTFQVDVSYSDYGRLLKNPVRLTFSGAF